MSDTIKKQIAAHPEQFDYPDLPASGPTDEQRAANERSRPDWMKDLIVKRAIS